MSTPPNGPQRTAIAAIRQLARDANLTVRITVNAMPVLPSGHGGKHQGTIYQRKDGLWVARIHWYGKRYQVTATTRAECERRLEALKTTLAAGWTTPPPLETETDHKGRQFVRISTPSFRRWIYARDRGVCGICREAVPFAEMHVDHIRPRSEGGSDQVDNYRISHAACNRERNLQRRRRILV